MDDQRLREIKERCERATKGDWDVDGGVIVFRCADGKAICRLTLYQDDRNFDNAEFIAHARQDIPDLVAEVEALKNILSSIEAVFGGIRTFCPVCRMGPDMEGIIHHKKDCRLGKALGRL